MTVDDTLYRNFSYSLKKQVLREVTEITVIDCHHPPNF
nr:MAG TPA: hypothetical protein [Caudoviricetes sp.]DAZ41138.1 MAG TPA: hypothetical protein [Caudoviricetes sp.]